MQMPRYALTENVLEVPGQRLRLSGSPTYDGEVNVEFVVDQTGHVAPHTFKAQASDDPLLRFSLRGAIDQLRYSPAMAAGCPVFRRVQQKFIYRAARRASP
jgi:hypothetical protein